ncbi:hypothetical protein COOONC_13464 [Cooperia oncophora]
MLRLGGPRVENLFQNYARAIAVHPSKIAEVKSAFRTVLEEAHLAFSITVPAQKLEFCNAFHARRVGGGGPAAGLTR